MRSKYLVLPLILVAAHFRESESMHAAETVEARYRALSPIVGANNPEDLIELDGTGWVIVSSMRTAAGEPGHLYAVKANAGGNPVEVYPTLHPAVEPDATTSQPGISAPDPAVFFPHGINAVRQHDGTFRLYVVNHGGREAVEMFRVVVTGGAPRVTWTGGILLPPRTFGNGVATMPDGGFVVSNMYDPTDPGYLEKFAKAEVTGHVLRWSKARGWARALQRSFSGANGVEISRDGKWLYVSEWSARRLWKLSLGDTEPAMETKLDFLPDNLRWSEEGTLLLAGQAAPAEQVFGCEARRLPCPMPFAVVEVDPSTLRVRTLIKGGDEGFGGATGAAFIGDELWVGSYRSNRVARYERVAPY